MSAGDTTATVQAPTLGGGQLDAGSNEVSSGSTRISGGGVVISPKAISGGRGSVGLGSLTAAGSATRITGGGITLGSGELTGPLLNGSGSIGGVDPGGVNLGHGNGTINIPTGSGGGGGLGLGSGILPGGGGLRTVIGGVPLTPGSLGARPGPGLISANPQFALGGSAGIIAPDSPNALRPAALGAFRDLYGINPGALAIEGANATAGIDFPAGILGIDPARAAAMYAAEGSSPTALLTPAALVGQQLPGNDGGTNVFRQVTDAIDSVLAHLPDWSRPIIGVLLLLVLLFGIRAMWSGRRARKLERARRALTADVAVLQAALVPDLPEQLGGLSLSVAYRPADGLASGGDFYDAFPLDERRTAIILGDVSGHDRRAIARASAIRHKLRAYLELGLEPRMVLHAAGEALASDTSLDGDFATAAVAVHDADAGTLTYACAGHPAPIIVGAGAHEPVSACSSPALGWGLPTGRRQTTVVLGDDDIVCFFTDGLVEARHNGHFLGRDGLEELVADLADEGSARQLLDKVIDLAHEADDDLAALVLRAGTPVAPRALRIEELEIGFHEVRRSAPLRFLAACDAPAEVLEQLGESMPAAVEESGRALLQLRFDPEDGGVEALVDPLPALAAPRRAALVG